MRIVLASLLATAAAIGAFVSVAQAQTPAAPAAQPAPAAQTPAPAPATPPAVSTPTPDATATPAAPAAPAAETPPTIPTTGDGAQIISLIEKVCVPLVRGGNVEQLAKAYGMKLNRRDATWQIQLGTTNKDYNITLAPPGVNKDVCRAEVHYALNQDTPVTTAVNIWSFLHQPELILQANYVSVNADGVKRVQKSWEHLDSASSTAVNFTIWTKPDDSSLNAKYSTGEIYYQERKLG
jgi:glucose/arabinose dehydrogenase